MHNAYNVERGLITKLLSTKDMVTVKDKQIRVSYFTGENKKAFRFISDYYMKKGEVPTVRVFKQKFPEYDLEKFVDPETMTEIIGTEESLLHWCDEIRKKVKHNKLADITEQVAENLENNDCDKAYEVMKKGILYIENEVEESTSVDITKNTEDRKAEYLKRKESGGIIGIPTGFDKLDQIIKGLQPKQLITLIARTGIGKTWFEVIIGANAQLSGLKVLQFVTEMSEEMMRDRYEAVLMGKIYGRFNYSRFKSGKLLPEEEKMYFEFLDKHLPKLEPLIIESATGVSSVLAKIEKHKPELVLIDSAYLMEDERGAKEDWLRVAHITRDLKSIAKKKELPIFINSQADSTTSKKTGPELDNIGYSKAVGEDSDVVLALFQDEQMREDREMKIKVLKQREGILGNVISNWDFNTMNFNPIYATIEKEMDSSPDEEKAGVINLE